MRKIGEDCYVVEVKEIEGGTLNAREVRQLAADLLDVADSLLELVEESYAASSAVEAIARIGHKEIAA